MYHNYSILFYKLNATASLIVGDGRIYMYDKNGNIPVLEQWKFDGEVTYHHNSHCVIQPCLTRLQVFTGPIFAKNGEPQNTGTPIELVNFDDYYSSVSEEEFLEWKTYLLSKYANPRQILQYPTKVQGAMSWRIPHQIEPTRSNAPNPKSGGEIAMRFGEVTWTSLLMIKHATITLLSLHVMVLKIWMPLIHKLLPIYFKTINKNSKTTTIITKFSVTLLFKLPSPSMRKTSTTTSFITHF